jgi:hypothetical protein
MSPRPQTRFLARWLLLACCLPGLACKSEETKEARSACNEALREGRLFAKNDDLGAARAKLTVAEGACTGPRTTNVYPLRAEIVRKAPRATRAAEEAARTVEKQREQPIVPFMHWVRTRRDATDKSEKKTECVEQGDPMYGWCVASHQPVDGVEYRTRFWKNDRNTFRFSVTIEKPAVCEDLGQHRVVRTWEIDGTRRVHCELLTKEHRGLSALVTTKGERSEVDVFDAPYVARDAEFAKTLKREGR